MNNYHWALKEQTGGYFFWQRREMGKTVYNCTKSEVPPDTDGGYYNLDALKRLKGVR